jgi:hypothetical protein
MAPPRTALVSLLVLLTALAIGAGPGARAAAAAPGQLVLFEAPRELLDRSSRPAALAELDGLGVRALRLVVPWREVAPAPDAATRPEVDLADPASYAWGPTPRSWTPPTPAGGPSW